MRSRSRPRSAKPNTAAVERRSFSRTLASPAILLAAIVDDGTIAYVDELVGRLAADLKARGLYEGATIALLSDHGEGLGDHGEQEHGVFLYDSTMHVPFIVKLPGERDAGNRAQRPWGGRAAQRQPTAPPAFYGRDIAKVKAWLEKR
jgi:hypothetical protein